MSGESPATDAAVPAGAGGHPTLLLATDVGDASGAVAVAAAAGVALAGGGAGALLVEIGAQRDRGPTMLASASARELEGALRGRGFDRVAARGRLCWLGLAPTEEALDELARALDCASGGERSGQPWVAVVQLPARLWPAALEHPELRPAAAVLRADLPADRALAAMAVIELRHRHLPVRIASRSLGRVAARRALAGLDAGGAAGSRVARLARGLARRAAASAGDGGQALVLALGAAFAVIFTAAVLAALGGAVTGTARVQLAADVAALSGARSLRDDFHRLFSPARLENGAPNPRHLDKHQYMARAATAARQAATHNGVDPSNLRVTFPDARSFAPVRVRVAITASLEARALPGRGEPPGVGPASGRRLARIAAHAEAEASVPAAGNASATATGGGYSGPLAYRQGKPMRPDVASAFDRMAAAARRAAISLVVNSAYRSDAEQARLYAQHPDPRWVAPPGHSLHRCATELDLGPPSAYPWLEHNAGRFGFLRRYPWERWHFGFTRGPAPCSTAGNSIGSGSASANGAAAGAPGLPGFVPPRFRRSILRAGSRWNVSAGLLAAQLMAESNFNPFAVSGAGAQGIAQFMPGTAATYGLRDPFDAPRAIDAQAHLMSDLLRQFGSPPLALAAYNAGPGAVAACNCVPDIPETQAYVARILGLMGGIGEIAAPTLEVLLVD